MKAINDGSAHFISLLIPKSKPITVVVSCMNEKFQSCIKDLDNERLLIDMSNEFKCNT